MIAENAADLVARVASIPSIAASSGLALGGHSSDPGLLKIPLPAAWIMFGGDQIDEGYSPTSPTSPALVPGVEIVMATYRVVIYVPYIDQTDLLATQYPLLESVIKAVRGNKAPSGHRWRYLGQKLSLVYNDRLAYEQRYTLDMVL